MANENTRFYVTADTSKLNAAEVTIATGNTPGNSSIIEVSIAKTAYEGAAGKSKVLTQLAKIVRKIEQSPWPAI